MKLLAACSAAVFLIAEGAQACTFPGYSPLDLDERGKWRETFRQDFDRAESVYVAQASRVGPLGAEPILLPCDHPVSGPMPEGEYWTGDKRGKLKRFYRTRLQYRIELRAVERARRACSADAVRFEVKRVLKGVPVEGWVERNSLLSVVDTPPRPITATTRAYDHAVAANVLFMCSPFYAVRLSARADYLVFFGPTSWDQDGTPTRNVRDVYLAEAGSPFLAEAEALARPDRVPPAN